MKNIVHRIKLSVWVLLVLFVTTSCESWLDVNLRRKKKLNVCLVQKKDLSLLWQVLIFL